MIFLEGGVWLNDGEVGEVGGAIGVVGVIGEVGGAIGVIGEVGEVGGEIGVVGVVGFWLADCDDVKVNSSLGNICFVVVLIYDVSLL